MGSLRGLVVMEVVVVGDLRGLVDVRRSTVVVVDTESPSLLSLALLMYSVDVVAGAVDLAELLIAVPAAVVVMLLVVDEEKDRLLARSPPVTEMEVPRGLRTDVMIVGGSAAVVVVE